MRREQKTEGVLEIEGFLTGNLKKHYLELNLLHLSGELTFKTTLHAGTRGP